MEQQKNLSGSMSIKRLSRTSSPERKVTLLLPKQRDRVKDLRDKVYRYAYVYSMRIVTKSFRKDKCVGFSFGSKRQRGV